MLALFGVLLLGIRSIKEKSITLDKELMPAILLAALFSIIGFISVDINYSSDYSYANYWISFSTWLLGAYTTCEIIRYFYGYTSFKLLFDYLIAVCVVQCFLALIIDNVEPFKIFIDTYISQSTVAEVEFLNRVERLYGIGAAVDVAGTRFSIVLLALSAILVGSSRNRTNTFYYWSAFVIITIIGNMMSRTTIIGTSLGILYIVLNSTSLMKSLSLDRLKMWRTIFVVTFIIVAIAVFFYQTNEIIREQIRFGFEGFFNWIEIGTLTTESTERLNSVMWIWPDSNDYKTWIIGKATFSDWHAVGTDIGYCRFVFYSGLLGLITFSLFFVCNAFICASKFQSYKVFFFFLLALTFIIWLKVATDLFIIYALFYCLEPKEVS
ncbi:hypothetical protein [Sphingobacterium hungaricum]|nr:hypothetical protein [Sphingobacterium hungaricum]